MLCSWLGAYFMTPQKHLHSVFTQTIKLSVSNITSKITHCAKREYIFLFSPNIELCNIYIYLQQKGVITVILHISSRPVLIYLCSHTSTVSMSIQLPLPDLPRAGATGPWGKKIPSGLSSEVVSTLPVGGTPAEHSLVLF